MCDFENGFILCKCNDPKAVVHNKKSRRNKLNPSSEYTWRLNRYVGKSQGMEIGRYSLPDKDLEHGLTSSFVLNELNSRNCFDFVYRPNEGDNLELVHAHSQTRIEFIFQNGKWMEDHYSPFDHVLEKIEQGKIMKL
jgi:hypothetical protein